MSLLDRLLILSPIIVTLGFPLVGLLAGLWIDREHRANLDYRRGQVGHVLVTDLRSYPGHVAGAPTEWISAEVVLANNLFFTILARLKMLFGGEVRGLHGLMTRARQEVVLRVMESAAEKGFNAVCNLRLEAVDISGQTIATGNRRNKGGLYIGLIAHGMAYQRAEGIYPPPAPPTLMEWPQ